MLVFARGSSKGQKVVFVQDSTSDIQALVTARMAHGYFFLEERNICTCERHLQERWHRGVQIMLTRRIPAPRVE